MTRLLRALRALGLAGLIALTLTQLAEIAAAELMEARHADPAALPRVDAILVLGAGMDPDGEIAWSSRRRVAAAVASLKAGRADHLILSGFSRDPRFAPAAEGMRDHALALGAPPEALTVEPLAINTLENLRRGYAIADAEGWDRVAVAGDAWHLARALALARWLGRDPALLAVDADWTSRPLEAALNHQREALAWWVNLARIARLSRP